MTEDRYVPPRPPDATWFDRFVSWSSRSRRVASAWIWLGKAAEHSRERREQRG